MADLTKLSQKEVEEGYREYSAEINRRHELTRIPEQITELATQGRVIGVEEQAMVDAVTRRPEVPVEEVPWTEELPGTPA